jgi:hypothetical protein
MAAAGNNLRHREILVVAILRPLALPISAGFGTGLD